MFDNMLKQIYDADCTIQGVSYKVCGRFFLPFCDCFAVVISERGYQGSPEELRFYSLYDLKTLSVISRESDRYLNIVKELPDFSGCKLTTSEPFKKWHYVNDMENILKVYFTESCENSYLNVREDYISYLLNMKGISDISMCAVYDYFISVA